MYTMLCILPILLPVLAALYCWKGKGSDKLRLNLMIATSAIHFVGSLALFTTLLSIAKAPYFASGPFLVDESTVAIFSLTSLLFLLVAIHTRFWYFAELKSRESTENPDGVMSNRVFTACMLGFLAAMSLVPMSNSIGLMWIAIEATTLVSAPLILFHRSKRSIEAMWKYLLICSVGIGLALLGIMFLAVAAHGTTLSFTELANAKYYIHSGWFKAAFILAVVGFGTKMGLAPFHTWLPDAHSEAPGTVSALLSAALLNGSFLAIYRLVELAPLDTIKDFCMEILVAFGILSLAIAALFIIGQDDYKRMLAYSTVEHMGFIAIFAGTPQAETYVFLQMWGHSLIKMTLFLLAGNVLLAYGTRQISRLGGLIKCMPRNAFLFLMGTLMLCGMPPSLLFFSELAFLGKAPHGLAYTVAALLFIVFAGMTRNVMKLTLGPQDELKPDETCAHAAERLVVIPIIVFFMVFFHFFYAAFRLFDYI